MPIQIATLKRDFRVYGFLHLPLSRVTVASLHANVRLDFDLQTESRLCLV